jgi:micrococcal nuclease
MSEEYRYGVRARCNAGFGLWQLAYASKAELNAEIRIASIDAPETRHAQCAAEKQLGKAATAMLRKLLSKGRVTVARGDPKSGRMIDKYGRTLGTVYIDGHDAGVLLIGAGLARPWRGKRWPWCTLQFD